MSDADDLLQRALTDAEACAAVALKVSELPLSEALTVIFHGRRDLGTLQTYVTNGGRGAGSAVGASELLRVPCDLDLADAATRDVAVDRSIELNVRLPAHRLMPVALSAPERRLFVAAVCGARTLAEGRPPLGIVCAQQDLARVYQLSDDPEHCLEDFEERAAEHARRTAQWLDHQDASVMRFLELNGDD